MATRKSARKSEGRSKAPARTAAVAGAATPSRAGTVTVGDTAAQPVAIVVDSQQHAARQLAVELEDRRARGEQLDKAKRPGGYYLGQNGQPHDANGKPISDDDGDGTPDTPDAIDVQIRELEARRDALRAARPLAEAKANADATAAAEAAARTQETAPTTRASKRATSARKSGATRTAPAKG